MNGKNEKLQIKYLLQPLRPDLRIKRYFCVGELKKSDMDSFTGKRILITGATSGIGRNTTLELIRNGANVAFCGKSEDKLKDLLTEIGSTEGQVILSGAFNIINEKEIRSFVNKTGEKLGGIDILINCAGVNSAKNLVEDIKLEDLEYMIKVNFIAPFLFIREVIKDMRVRKSGLIINILSSSCLFSSEGVGAYSSSKSGFDALTKILRKEVRKDHIGVCSIYPGGVDTPFRKIERSDYLRTDDVVKAIIYVINAGPDVAFDELVLRPFVETNL
jgi:NAD(P)-dependent dehydrogenase (short-subunit alcohol dehydrogenase family)